ncbi:hypothetical protein GQ600_12316 [Phytophthora cactorum]|nr:hypothetical protein GQ600_12316 [Phytophthora cactorum]
MPRGRGAIGSSVFILGDVVRQLCTLDEYPCSLVNEGDSAEESSFRAVSFLDDYISRPVSFDGLGADNCCLGGEEDLPDVWELDESKIAESMALNPSVCPTAAVPDSRITHILDSFSSFHMFRGTADKTYSRSTNSCSVEDIPPLDYMLQWIANADTDNAITGHTRSTSNGRDTQIIDLLDAALNETSMNWTPTTMDNF